MNSSANQPYAAGAPLSTVINWSDINFPFFYRIVHFNLDELTGSMKSFALKLYLHFLIIVLVVLINILSAIIQQTQHYGDNLILFYAFMNLFVIIIPAGHVSYLGYVAICTRYEVFDVITRYRLYQALMCVFWFVLSIVPSGSFDGWMRISVLMDYNSAGAKFCIFLTVLESLGFTVAFILGLICICTINKVNDEPEKPKFPIQGGVLAQ